MILFLLLLSSLSSSVLSLCGSRPPSDGDYGVLAIGVDGGPLTSILNEARDEGVVRLAMNSPSDECDQSCLFTLLHYDAPHHHSSLVVRKELSELVPIGYTLISNRSTVLCARSPGSCGATVPVYRHFSLNGSGIYHTYSLEDSVVNGYTKEPVPLCFVWDQQAVDVEGSGVEPALSSDERLKRDNVLTKEGRACDFTFPNRTKMEMLTEYINNRTGTELDHFYTLKTSNELSGYNRTRDVGLILTKNDSSCACLVTLVQTFDTQTGIFHRIDHKLMRSDAELNRIFEKYNHTGEKFYCAAQKGQCGASLPLYKHFDFVHIDSIITTSDKDVPPHSYRYPSEPLCWIWSASYDPIEEGSGEEVEVTNGTTRGTSSTVRVSTQGRVKRTTEWEEEETDWTDETGDSTMWNTTARPTTGSTVMTNGTTRGTSSSSPSTTLRVNSTTVRLSTPMSNSTVRSTVSSPLPTVLDEIIVRMVRSAVGNDSDWRDVVRRKLREISERI